ncbi:MAG: bifunctional adenosylcobinamide kinase/adenosylcobinamide-phosphate guanylyltransferase [PVC group bacterium]|nr:bifunctional adenosylcobinamide kinase/adenosylcobinamide-phosphate guanylyltransferase [PVC group bacterium]
MKNIIFITGSVRSGKSNYAVKLAKQSKQKIIFLATCTPADAEMKQRVRKHKKSRPKNWQTIEEPIDVISVLKQLKDDELVIFDCLTLWVSNLLLSGFEEKEVIKIIEKFVEQLKINKANVIIVSNEVGWGIVPENKLARVFRDIIGTAHQKIAKVSDEAYLMVAGMPMKIKGDEKCRK